MKIYFSRLNPGQKTIAPCRKKTSAEPFSHIFKITSGIIQTLIFINPAQNQGRPASRLMADPECGKNNVFTVEGYLPDSNPGYLAAASEKPRKPRRKNWTTQAACHDSHYFSVPLPRERPRGEPRFGEFLAAIRHVLATEDAKLEHLLRRQLRFEIRMKLFADWQ
ncbi:MAG: hypothetical protein NUV51_07715 [Sulfuricaulis sp.]|nr:hypothetical protein [Sulfuricaulis sp.]